MQLARIHGLAVVSLATATTLLTSIAVIFCASIITKVCCSILALLALLLLNEALKALIVVWTLPETGSYCTALLEGLKSYYKCS